MISVTTVPSPRDSLVDHADFLEIHALTNVGRMVCVDEYLSWLRLASADEVAADSEWDWETEEESDQNEPLAMAAFRELDDRMYSCGKDLRHYPFEIGGNSLKLRHDGEKSVYTFLALLSWCGKDAGPRGTSGAKLFEEICARAAADYLGGPSQKVKWFVFGFPRRVQPRGFKDALDNLCSELGEGLGHHKGRLKLPHEKDGKLDVVAWREFDDRRPGKLITFGQCATGGDWVTKVTELPQAVDWCTTWMADRPGVWPVRSFFVPHRIDRTNWFDTCVKGGILLDRCRIASLASGVDTALEAELARWSSHVLNRIREEAT